VRFGKKGRKVSLERALTAAIGTIRKSRSEELMSTPSSSRATGTNLGIISAKRGPFVRAGLSPRVSTALFLAPALTIFAVFFLVPNALNFAYAFTDWSTFSSSEIGRAHV